MLTVDAYLGQHSQGHEEELSALVRDNAAVTVAKANELCACAGIEPVLRSGWRPAGYNATVVGAAAKSTHITGEAVDLADTDGSLRDWCAQNLAELARIGLWMEDARTTPTWLHIQTRPPASGKRVYIPSALWLARLQQQGGSNA